MHFMLYVIYIIQINNILLYINLNTFEEKLSYFTDKMSVRMTKK